MKGIRINNITKDYDSKNNVIEDFNLNIADGEFVVLLGPSGCGKSTLLRIIAGLEPTSKGEIFIDDENITNKEPKDRNIAMVFQNYALYPHMTVYKNIAIGLMLKNTPRNEVDKRVDEVAKILDISDLLDRKPRQLSGGQMQRVALARAMIRNPKVFLMDEPLSNLDSKLRVATRSEIIKLYKRLKITTIYVTHDQVEAMTMATTIVLMKDGKIQQKGTPNQLYSTPATTFVAEFIGSPQMNFIDAKIENKILYYLDKQMEYELENKKVIIGIRPEHCSLIPGGDFSVDLVENLGSEKLIYVKSSKDDLEITLRCEASSPVEVGDRCNVQLDPENFHIFDQQTKERIN